MKGDRVVVFCCGTGLDFPPILERVGNRGQIIGIDFSAQMLRLAKEKVQKFKWNNVDLIQADVSGLIISIGGEFFQDIPQPMIDQANHHGLPIITIPMCSKLQTRMLCCVMENS